MARGKKHGAEQAVNLLGQIEVAIVKTTGVACKEADSQTSKFGAGTC